MQPETAKEASERMARRALDTGVPLDELIRRLEEQRERMTARG